MPPLLLDLDAVDDALRAVAAARERVDGLRARSRSVQDAVQWQAPSARAFRVRAEMLTEMLAAAASDLDLVGDGLRRTRAHLVTAGTP